jgi:hypothetical protein
MVEELNLVLCLRMRVNGSRGDDGDADGAADDRNRGRLVNGGRT